MVGTSARHRIILSLLIVAESIILTAVVPQLISLGRVTIDVIQTAFGQ
jgi:hypothetical protein